MDLDPVGEIMTWIGAYGLVGLFAIALAERFVPFIPSHGLLLAIGISAADEAWPLSAAFFATVGGGMFGCAALFHALRLLGTMRCARLLERAGQILGMSTDSIEWGIASFRSNQVALAFVLQLVPTVRLFAPAFAALFRGSFRSFMIASAAGVAVWNGLFIGIGFYASHAVETENMTILALAALGCLLVVEAALLWLARRVRARRRAGTALCET